MAQGRSTEFSGSGPIGCQCRTLSEQDVEAATWAMHACQLLPDLREGVLDPDATISTIAHAYVHPFVCLI